MKVFVPPKYSFTTILFRMNLLNVHIVFEENKKIGAASPLSVLGRD